jgi:hypothetical protein
LIQWLTGSAGLNVKRKAARTTQVDFLICNLLARYKVSQLNLTTVEGQGQIFGAPRLFGRRAGYQTFKRLALRYLGGWASDI